MRQRIGGCGSHEQSINRLRDCDVFDGCINVGSLFAMIGRRKHSSDNFLSGKRGEGEGTHKFLRGLGHDDLHADAAVLQKADDFGGLISSDAAGDAEGDLHNEFQFSIFNFRLPSQSAITNRPSKIPSPCPAPCRDFRRPARRRCEVRESPTSLCRREFHPARFDTVCGNWCRPRAVHRTLELPARWVELLPKL